MRNLLLYIAIALGILAILIVLAVYVPNVSHGWFIFGGTTTFLVAFLLKMYWPVRSKWKTWPLLGLLLLVHVGFYIVLLHYVQDVPILSYFLSIPIEVMLFQSVVYKAVGVLPPKLKL